MAIVFFTRSNDQWFVRDVIAFSRTCPFRPISPFCCNDELIYWIASEMREPRTSFSAGTSIAVLRAWELREKGPWSRWHSRRARLCVATPWRYCCAQCRVPVGAKIRFSTFWTGNLISLRRRQDGDSQVKFKIYVLYRVPVVCVRSVGHLHPALLWKQIIRRWISYVDILPRKNFFD